MFSTANTKIGSVFEKQLWKSVNWRPCYSELCHHFPRFSKFINDPIKLPVLLAVPKCTCKLPSCSPANDSRQVKILRDKLVSDSKCLDALRSPRLKTERLTHAGGSSSLFHILKIVAQSLRTALSPIQSTSILWVRERFSNSVGVWNNILHTLFQNYQHKSRNAFNLHVICWKRNV